MAQTEESLSADEILKRASEQTKEYLQTFRNLAATEKKTFETLRSNGSVKKSRTVESNFIVYQLSKQDDKIVEYRHVLAVDGKRLEKADLRAQDFFEKLMKVENSSRELEQIKNESLRYDDEVQFDGYTLFQGVALSSKLADVVDHDLARTEIIDGVETYVLNYQQVSPSNFVFLVRKDKAAPADSLISFDPGDRSNEEMNVRLRGTLWIDKATLQIRREMRELTIQPDGTAQPTVISQTKFNYQNSEFGILTPKRIESTIYHYDKKKATTTAEVRAIFEYSSFSRPDVEVESSEVKGKEN